MIRLRVRSARVAQEIVACLLVGVLARGQQPVSSPATQATGASATPRNAAQNAVSGASVYAPVYSSGHVLELTLGEARETALKNNLGLQLEALTTDVAFYSYQGSYGVYDWKLGAQANFSDSKFNPGDLFSFTTLNTQSIGFDLSRPIDTGGTISAHYDVTHLEAINPNPPPNSFANTVSLGFVQPLLRGAWREYTTANQRIADLDWRRQGEHERQVRQKLLLDTSLAYWDLVSAKEQLEVAESSLELARTQVDQDKRRFEAGVGTEIDVLQAETKVAMREENRLNADVRLRQSMDTLKALIFPGKDRARWDTAILPTTPSPEQVSAESAPSWADALGVALEHRAELREQRLFIDSNGIQLAQRESERLPALDLSFNALGKGFSGSNSDSFSDAVSYAYPTYTAALTFSFPLENTTARFAEKTAWANVRSARLVYDQLESQIVADVRFAVRQVVYQAEAVHAAAKSLELARRQLKAGQDRRTIGSSTNFEVLQLQQDLAESMSNERATRVAFGKALVALEAAQGLLGDSPRL
jgi:outer membrane protein TolC